MDIHRLDDNTLLIPRQGRMVTEATVFARKEIKIEDEALRQLCDAASIDPEAIVLATPDIHSGYGVPIGCVWATPHFISPAAVGYDINCGMRLMTTPLDADQVDVKALADSIRRDIPLGEGKRSVELPQREMAEFLSRGVPAVGMLAAHNSRFAEAFRPDELAADLLRIEDGGSLAAESEAMPEVAAARGRVQFGTLGGGNHFIELERVDIIFDAALAEAWGLRQGQLVVMIHSGSRGLGHEVGGQFMKLALQVNEKRGDPLPSRQLMYLSIQSKEGRQYHQAMNCAANFAYANRQVMATLVRHDLRHALGDIEMPLVYDVAHNIAKFEMVDGRGTVPTFGASSENGDCPPVVRGATETGDCPPVVRGATENGDRPPVAREGQLMCVHRKGATRAFPPSLMQGTPFEKTGQPVLIPGSMGTASYLLSGIESGRRSLYSVNHGAGRAMSRTEAAGPPRRGKHGRGKPHREGPPLREGAITDQAFREAMDGIYLVCEDQSRIKEEAPQAYKDIEVVIDTVVGAGLANRVARFLPLAVLKG